MIASRSVSDRTVPAPAPPSHAAKAARSGVGPFCNSSLALTIPSERPGSREKLDELEARSAGDDDLMDQERWLGSLALEW